MSGLSVILTTHFLCILIVSCKAILSAHPFIFASEQVEWCVSPGNVTCGVPNATDHRRYKLWSCQNVCDALSYLLDNDTYLRFATKLYRQIVGFPMGTYCAPLVAVLFSFCYERDFVKSLSDDNRADIIEAFNWTSRYMIPQISPLRNYIYVLCRCKLEITTLRRCSHYDKILRQFLHAIMLTCPCNANPLTPHFYIV